MRQHNEGKSIVTNMGDVLNGLVIAGLTPKSLPLLHSLTGFHTNIFLFGITKKKAWSTYITCHGLLDGRDSTQPSCEDIEHADEFMGRLYKDTPCTKLDELRRDCMHIQRAFL